MSNNNIKKKSKISSASSLNAFKLTEKNCKTSTAYAQFRKQFRLLPFAVKPTDLFLYTNDCELLSRQALTFFKYYATADVNVMRFRLKYTVYGFYWQHPVQTYISGIISSFVHLDNPQMGDSDPQKLLQRTAAPNTSHTLVVGDLNHFGGWFCKYCQQPDEIISELHAGEQSNSLQNVKFPNITRNHHIDADYLQKLIANGIYVNDGSTQLIKVRRYTDKYYAPLYAEENSWKFGNLLVNLYESLDEDIDDEIMY